MGRPVRSTEPAGLALATAQTRRHGERVKTLAVLVVGLALGGCAGKVNNKPAAMPGSPEEAEQMLQDNTPDKAPPDDPEAPDPEPEE